METEDSTRFPRNPEKSDSVTVCWSVYNTSLKMLLIFLYSATFCKCCHKLKKGLTNFFKLFYFFCFCQAGNNSRNSFWLLLVVHKNKTFCIFIVSYKLHLSYATIYKHHYLYIQHHFKNCILLCILTRSVQMEV